jgi:hypothetical protein
MKEDWKFIGIVLNDRQERSMARCLHIKDELLSRKLAA